MFENSFSKSSDKGKCIGINNDFNENRLNGENAMQ